MSGHAAVAAMGNWLKSLPEGEANTPRPGAATATATAQGDANQFALLGQRRYAPFFWTQFSASANDNLFKFAFTLLVTYQLQVVWLPPTMAGLVIGALSILPYLLFSATAGQFVDKWDRTRTIRLVKNFEIGIMALAAWGFVAPNVVLLLGCVFLMGVHATVFGPVKFAYLPQVLSERELTGGNGMVEMGTFVAVLLGNLLGVVLIGIPRVGHLDVAVACLAVAVAGRVTAQFVPWVASTDPHLKIDWNPWRETWRNLKLAHGNPVIFRSLLGISWMWFFGAAFLGQFPSYAKNVLHGDSQVAAMLLAVFAIGIGIGSLLCEMLSRRHVEIGLVPLGAIGMSVFAVDFYFASRALPPVAHIGLVGFLSHAVYWHVIADLGLLSLFAGLYSVPLYALIQLRATPTHRARIMAANNVLNALFMIVSSVMAGALLGAGWSIGQILLAVGVANGVVAFFIFLLVPEYLLRFVAWVATHLVYRFRIQGGGHIPVAGAAVLVCNHVSFIDAVLLMAASPRPIRFLMGRGMFAMPVLGMLFRLAKVIPITPQNDDPQAYATAFERAAQALRDGELLAIFPEGGLTRDGGLQGFKGGIMKILRRAEADGLDVPVIPMALTHLWGSFFSRVENGAAMVRLFRRGVWSRVGLNVGSPMRQRDVTLRGLRHQVDLLLSQG